MPARRGPLILSVVGAPYGEDIGGYDFIRITRGCPESQGAGRRATGTSQCDQTAFKSRAW